MAEKPKTHDIKPKQPQPAKSGGWIFKTLALVSVLVILVGIGFAAGVYFKIVDIEKMAADLNLSQYPVIGSFFSQQRTNFETVELQEDVKPMPPEAKSPMQSTKTVPALQPANPNIITKEDLEKQDKLRQQEEAKRIAKLARLYGSMKPDEATAIMRELDDNTVIAILNKMEDDQVAKILALFDTKRAASLTQDMFKGQIKRPTL